MSVAGPGEKLLISRNAHKSVISGVAEVMHEHDLPLIVDEAWGAHLPFHPDLPAWGMDAGADLVVTSVHKMGGAVEQSSVFHLQGDRVDPDVLEAREDLLGTTSSSGLVYLTLDGWRRQMVEHGEELLGAAIERAGRIRAAIGGMTGLDLMGREVIGTGGAFDVDPLVFTIDVRGLGITGYQAGEWVRANRHVDIGSADACRISARITHADDDETERILVDALRALVDGADGIEKAPAVDLPAPRALELESVMSPRAAFFAPVEQVPVEEAAGRVVAEMVSPYPPGVPVLAPGERITREVLDYLTTGVAAGMLIPDAADPELKSLRVVAE
jgi:arginine/lysine/ornithine decarboxylase